MEIMDGIWPVMITPFHPDGSIDYDGLDMLVEWYIQQGCNGLFAVCQSSEMFFLTLEERVSLAKSVVKKVAGRIPVVISGHISKDQKDQIHELQMLANCGADALVLVSNRLVKDANESDAVFNANLKLILKELPPEMPLGFYECPYPFKRLLTPDVLKCCMDSGRFRFVKDTCCDISQIREKLSILSGSGIKLFNANTATLLESLQSGADGYSGVMANFHPALYRKMYQCRHSDPEKAVYLQSVLSMCALIELKKYPACAKRYLRTMEHIPMTDYTRKDACILPFADSDDHELKQLKMLSDLLVLPAHKGN